MEKGVSGVGEAVSEKEYRVENSEREENKARKKEKKNFWDLRVDEVSARGRYSNYLF